MILAIDTSDAQSSLALADEGQVLAELSWTSVGSHSRRVGSALERLLALENIKPPAITSVVVASGPGSFSGLRVGISLAKGLAIGLDVPLVGVSALDVIGLEASCCEPDVWALLSAGRGRLYAAHYAHTGGDFERISGYLSINFDEIARLVGPDSLLAGPPAEEVAGALWSTGTTVRYRSGAWALRRAGFLAKLGASYLASGGQDQRDTLEPLYLRQPAAEEKRAAP